MVMPSPARNRSRSCASAADFETFARPIVSKAATTGGMGPLGALRLEAFLSAWRNTSSLQPPQPGTNPTPVSTRPI